LGRRFVGPVVDGVSLAKERSQSAAVGQALARPDLARVRVDDDIRTPMAADRQKAYGLLGVVEQLMGALLPESERNGLALLELTAALSGA